MGQKMIISADMNKRWYDLCPAALDAHQPAAGKRQLINPPAEKPALNLAVEARVSVDSFYGTLNSADEAGLYPRLNQVEITWQASSQPGLVGLRFCTFTPNFTGFRWRIDGAEWKQDLETVRCWQLHEGENAFEIQVVNSAGHAGKSSRLRFAYRTSPAASWPQGLAILEEDKIKAAAGPVPFLWEDFCHPHLQALRQKYNLDGVVAGANSDLERAVRLRDWVKSRWDHEQPVTPPPWDALYFLDRTDKKIEAFYCVHYSITFMQCCLTLGIPARLINLGRGICRQDTERGYGREMDANAPCDEHVVNEVWVDDLGKWVMMDVDFDIHYSLDGLPLNALEIHRALVEDHLDRLSVCEGPHAYKLRSDERFYQYRLTVYYTHFSVFWRNNHLSDPEGPTRVWHWVDEKTPPMLWWEGSDLRHRSLIIGPVGISWPYQLSTPRLNDENLATCWASSEEPAAHWVELRWDRPVTFNQVVLDWPQCWGRYWTSRDFQLEAWDGTGWQAIDAVHDQTEAAASCRSLAPTTTERLRLLQPAGGGPVEFPNRLWLAEIEVYLQD